MARAADASPSSLTLIHDNSLGKSQHGATKFEKRRVTLLPIPRRRVQIMVQTTAG